MDNNICISIIIPQRNSIQTLRRLFDSIPNKETIEIIVVDNSPEPITKSDINIDRNYELYWADPKRFAGGARNVGMDHAHGKWLVFADADDYFTENAFDVFFANINDTADVIYFGMTGIYDDTGEFSTRGDYYTNKVQDYLAGKIGENSLKYKFGSPCSKMVKKSLVDTCNLKYDEVVASNDSYFALTIGYYAKSVKAVDAIVYVATVSRGSLTKRKDFNAVHSRYLVKLRMNRFIKANHISEPQYPVIFDIYECFKASPKSLFRVLAEAVRYGQNIMLGFNPINWFKTLTRKKSEKEKSYEVK